MSELSSTIRPYSVNVLDVVNNAINLLEYEKEPEGRDEWQTPVEFLNKGSGDCEDFAIAKYFMLRGIGFPVVDLKMVYCLMPAPHMILLVNTVEHGSWILDNIDKKDIYRKEECLGQPVYGFNTDRLFVIKDDWTEIDSDSALIIERWKDLLTRIIA